MSSHWNLSLGENFLPSGVILSTGRIDAQAIYLEALMQQSNPNADQVLATTPVEISAAITKLCASLVPQTPPNFISVEPLAGLPLNECFATVDEKILQSGGTKQHGWMIWEWPGIMIEAEFHAVWRSPAGELIDVSPKGHGEKRILFLADPKRIYRGMDIDNARVAIFKDQLTQDFFAGAHKFRALLNSGRPVGSTGEVSVSAVKLERLENTRLLIRSMLAGGLTSNDACLCQSGKKYKSCHGQLFRRL